MNERHGVDGSPYKVRKQTANGGYESYSIGIPHGMGRLIPTDARFVPVLTEDGILFRFVGQDGDERGLPHWVAPKDPSGVG